MIFFDGPVFGTWPVESTAFMKGACLYERKKEKRSAFFNYVRLCSADQRAARMPLLTEDVRPSWSEPKLTLLMLNG